LIQGLIEADVVKVDFNYHTCGVDDRPTRSRILIDDETREAELLFIESFDDHKELAKKYYRIERLPRLSSSRLRVGDHIKIIGATAVWEEFYHGLAIKLHEYSSIDKIEKGHSNTFRKVC
jgi:hypothetical protein